MTFPGSVASIGERAFQFCEGLARFNWPAQVKEIPANTFEGCASLSEFTIPSGVTGIGSFAFAESGLRSLRIPGSVETIADRALANLNLESLAIEEGLRTLGAAAFENNTAPEIHLPASLTEIAAEALDGCAAKIVVPKGSDAEEYCKNYPLPYYYPDGSAPQRWLTYPNRLLMGVGEKLKQKVESEVMKDSFKYESSDKLVATINKSGQISAKKKGSTVITITSQKDGALARCLVTVKPSAKKFEKLRKTSYTLAAGESLTFNTRFLSTVYGESIAKLKASTSKKGIVDVAIGEEKDSGHIDCPVTLTGKKPGKVKVTLTTCNGLKRSCTVTVKPLPKTIRVTKAETTLAVGQTETLKYKVNSGSRTVVTWKSDDDDIVQVDANGALQAVGEGTTKVTVTSYNGKSASCTVRVLPAPTELIVPESVTIGWHEHYTIQPAVNEGSQATYTFDYDPESYVEDILDVSYLDGEIFGRALG